MLKYLILASLVLTSCATVKKTPEDVVNIGHDATLHLSEPKEIFPEIQLVQVLTIQHQDKTHSNQVILTSKDNKLSIVSLLPFGGEVFRVEYEKGIFSYKALPMVVSKDFDLKYALADIILVYGDSKVLSKLLSSQAEIVDKDLTRTILYKSEPMIQIKYDRADKYGAVVDYEHLARKYKIHIQPLSQGKP